MSQIDHRLADWFCLVNCSQIEVYDLSWALHGAHFVHLRFIVLNEHAYMSYFFLEKKMFLAAIHVIMSFLIS